MLAAFIVDTFADSATGICGVDGVGNSGCSLRSAIIAANSLTGADTITLPAGTHNLSVLNTTPSNETVEGSLDVTDSLTITGSPSDPTSTVVDADLVDDRAFFVYTAVLGGPAITVAFDGLTIQGGQRTNSEPGGGILGLEDTSLEIRRSIVQNNGTDTSAGSGLSIAAGGGIATGGNLLLADAIIINNTAEVSGGGIALIEAGTLTIANSTISNNTSGLDGGGIWAGNGSNYQISLTDTIIEENETGATAEGGGLFVSADLATASVSLNRVNFRNNTAGFGGGGASINQVASLLQTSGSYEGNIATDGAGGGLLVFEIGSVNVNSTTFVGNRADDGGGGAAVYTDATFRNVMIDQNVVTGAPIAGVIRFDLGGGGIAIAQPGSVPLTVRIEDSLIQNNTAALAAGIGSANAFVEIVNTTVRDNQANSNVGGGGGIGFAQDDTMGVTANRVRLTIENSTISGNTSASEAGGIGIADADAVFTDSTISGNSTAAGRAGGIGIIGFNNSPTLTLDRVTINNNSANTDGGGVALADASFDFTNTTISTNTANGNGGGLAFATSNPLITGSVQFSTIAFNSSDGAGSNVAVNGAVTRFLSSIISNPSGTAPAFNFVSGGPGQLSSQGFNLVSDSSSSFAASSDLIGVNPLLGGLASNGGAVRTHSLGAGSPAIDAGAGQPLPVDARNLLRPFDGDGNGTAENDIGAFERQTAPAATLSLGNQIFFDNDNSGTFDSATENGIQNVIVSLFQDTNSNGVFDILTDTAVATTLTDVNGNYLFTGLAAGDYLVFIDSNNFELGGALYGLISSDENALAPDPDNNIDNDDNGTPIAGTFGVASAAITLAPNTEPDPLGGPSTTNTNLTLDFGFIVGGFSTVKGIKFNDINGDGDNEGGADPGLQGVSIILSGESFNSGDFSTRIATTDDTGQYRFDGVPAGNFTVTEAPISVQSLTVFGGNSPVDFTDTVAFDGHVDPVANDELVISERVFRVSETQQWIEVTYTRRNNGPLVSDVNANWFANFSLTTDVPVVLSGANSNYFYFSVDGVPLAAGPNGFTHPFDPAGFEVVRLNDARNNPPSTSISFGLFSNPFNFIFSQFGLPSNNIANVSSITQGYLLTTTAPRTSTTPVPVNLMIGDSQSFVDPSQNTGSGEIVVAGLAIGNQVPSSVVSLDFGDAPDSYRTLLSSNGPRHQIVNGFSLGPTVTAETDAIIGGDVNDGVQLLSPAVPGSTTSFSINVNDLAGRPFYVDAWFDWNRDGTFDSFGEVVRFRSVNAPGSQSILATGTNTISVNVPSSAAGGSTFARIRLSELSGLGPMGLASSGEVEDINFLISSPGTLANPDSFSIDANSPPNLLAVLNNDADSSLSPLTITSVDLVSQSTLGSVFINSDDRSLFYTPPLGYTGSDSFLYTVTNASGQTGTALVTLNVQGVMSSSLLTLTTGSGDGGLTVQVDGFGVFGVGAVSAIGGAIADYDPVGPLPAADAVFESFLAFRTSTTGIRDAIGNPRFSSPPSSPAVLINPITGDAVQATSRFSIGSLIVDLTQRVEPTLDATGARIGSRLIQTYSIANPTAVSAFLDLVRFNHADLLFDGSARDGGGVLLDSSGQPTLFVTDPGSVGSTSTTFVGITATGGQTQATDLFAVDRFSLLSDAVLAGTRLPGTVVGDGNGDGFIDFGNEYDVALALRNLLTINAGQSAVYETSTIFGNQPSSVVPQQTGEITGQVSCNTGSIVDVSDVRVFVDLNGDRLLTSGEPSTLTDSSGFYRIMGVSTTSGQAANVVVQNPPTCAAIAPEIGVTRRSLSTGALSRGLIAIDTNQDQIDDTLLVVNELSNDVTVFVKDFSTGNFFPSSPIQLGQRSVGMTAWQPSSSGSPVVAVASFGTSANHGSIHVIENGQVVDEFTLGDGPVSVAVEDFDGDGEADFVAAALRSGTILARFSGPNGLGEEQVLTTARSPKAVKVAFLNDDSFPDLIVVAYGFESDDSSELIALINDGSGNFTERRDSIPGRGAVDVEVADFGNDSIDELVIGSYDGNVRIYDFSSGSLSLLETLVTEVGIESIAVGDLNQDGLLDIVVANSKAETIELFIDDLSAGFVRNRTISGVPSPSDIAVGNFDNDGVLDLAVSNLYGSLSPSYTVPSSVTILGLTISEREVMVTANQSSSANFQFAPTPLLRLSSLPTAAASFDVDRSGSVGARDALQVINAVSRSYRAEGESSSHRLNKKLDVNADGKVTVQDALEIINYMSRMRRAKTVAAESLVANPDDELQKKAAAVDALMADAGSLF